VKVLDILDSRPRRFSLPLAFGLGLALGFYPGAALLLPCCAAAAAIAGLGNAIAAPGGLRAGGNRALRGRQALALALGLAAGASLAWNEAGKIGIGFGPAPEWLGRPEAAQGPRLCRLKPVWAEGRLTTDSSPAKNGFRSYQIRVARLGLAGTGPSAELSYPHGAGGLRILVRAGPLIDAGALVRASGSFNFGTEAGASKVPGGGAAAGTLLFASPRELELIDRGHPLDRLRSLLRGACTRALARVGRRSSGLMQALILGVRDSLSPEEADAFKAAGCSHILALSGEHLSVLAVLAIAALRPLAGPVRARLFGALLASLFMWIAGAGPSLLRAVLMVWIGAIALALDRPQDWLGALVLAFIISLPLDPAGARSLSFTLSYLAVWGLAILSPRFSFLLGRVLPPFLRESASASLAAQAAVSPLLAFTFGYLQFAGILASMAAGPIVMLMMWWGMGCALLCSLLPVAAAAATPISDLLYSILMAIMRGGAAVPVLSLPSPSSQLLASLAVAGLAALVYARPYAEYRASGRCAAAARLRFAPGPEGPPRGGGFGHVQALRPEFPGE
jgi:ComEC/Rec2-related protein